MALHTKKLYYRRGGTTYSIDLYTTTAEVGSEYLSLRDGSTTVYAKIDTVGSANESYLRVRKSGVTKSLLNTITSALSLSPTTISTNYIGGTSSVAVTSAAAWTSSSNQTWLTASPSSGSTSTTVNLTAARYGMSHQAIPPQAPRTAVFTVTSGANTKTVTVSQSSLKSVVITMNTSGVQTGSYPTYPITFNLASPLTLRFISLYFYSHSGLTKTVQLKNPSGVVVASWDLTVVNWYIQFDINQYISTAGTWTLDVTDRYGWSFPYGGDTGMGEVWADW